MNLASRGGKSQVFHLNPVLAKHLFMVIHSASKNSTGWDENREFKIGKK
jgi:hypothetical protein